MFYEEVFRKLGEKKVRYAVAGGWTHDHPNRAMSPMTDQRHAGPDCAPFYDVAATEVFHDRTDCPLGRSIPTARRRIDVAAMRGRLSGW